MYELASSLPSTYEPTIACGEGSTLKEKSEQKGIPVITLPSLKRDISIFDVRAFIEVYNAINDTDVIHLNSSKIGLFGVLAGRLHNLSNPDQKVKIIFTSHGWAFNDARFSYPTKILFKLLQWITVILSHQTITVSNAVKKEMEHMPLTKRKMITIHNGIKEFEILDQAQARAKLGPEIRSEIWIGTISELTPNKGIDSAIRAFGRIAPEYPHTTFFILGEGEQKEELQALVQVLNLSKQVILCGYVPQANTYLSAFDIVTLTSRTDAFPYSLLEAGVAGVPTIASRVGGIPEIIENTLSGILTRPDNIREIESAMRFMLDNPQRRLQMGETFRHTTTSRFSFEKMINRITSLYQKIPKK